MENEPKNKLREREIHPRSNPGKSGFNADELRFIRNGLAGIYEKSFQFRVLHSSGHHINADVLGDIFLRIFLIHFRFQC